MVTLVIGGAASGKSEYAEQSLLKASEGPRVYIATLHANDAESEQRIQKHREARAGRSFRTIECYTGLDRVVLEDPSDVLLDCMGNLLANELYDPDGAGRNAVSAILRGVDHLIPQCRNLVLVTNEVGAGGTDYEGDTLTYLKYMGELNRALAARADRVAEVAAGLPLIYKGGDTV